MNSRDKGCRGELMTNEIWKDVVGYEGLYQTSNLGRIKNYKGKIMALFDDGHGYLHLSLYKNGYGKNFKVHRIVASAFIDNPELKKTVNHIDGNKKNNNVENLEWATYSENHKHAYRIGLKVVSDKQRACASITGTRTCDVNRPRTPVIAMLDGKEVKTYKSAHEAERDTKASATVIIRCCKGKAKHSGDYEWRYADAYK